MHMRGLWFAVLVAGCGSDGGGSSVDAPHAPIDTPHAVDAPAPDAFVPDGAPPAGDHFHYVISREYVPTNNTQAVQYGLDLDGNGSVDNQLGSVLAALSAQGAPVQLLTDRSVDRGDSILLVDIQTQSFVNSIPVGFTTYVGANPNPPACNSPADNTCRHHFSGSATFDVLAGAPTESPLVGSIAGGVMTAGPGHLVVNANVLGQTVTLDLIGARVRLHPAPTGITTGSLAGAVTMADLNAQVFPAVASGLQAQVALDCPGTTPPSCGCATGSSGATYLNLFDGDIAGQAMDCKVELNEVQASSLIQSLFAPDVTIEGQQALSLGIGVEAVGAVFTP